MASISQDTMVRPINPVTGRNGLVDRYFYFAMSLLLAAIVVLGFSRTVDHSLIHAAPARPLLLWIHGAAFSAWVIFYIFQSALVRTRNVKWHRFFGWFGTGLAAFMVPLAVWIVVSGLDDLFITLVALLPGNNLARSLRRGGCTRKYRNWSGLDLDASRISQLR